MESSSIHSEEVKEIIDYKPGWFVRKGNSIILIVIIIILGMTCIIKYPYIVTGNSKIVAISAPKLVIAKVDGKLLNLKVVNEELVKKGQIIGLMESVASFQEVNILKHWVDVTIQNNITKNDSLFISPIPALKNLGELQNSYSLLALEANKIKTLLAGNYFDKIRSSINNDIYKISEQRSINNGKKNLITQDKILREKELNAYKLLENEKIAAPVEVNEYLSKVIETDQQLMEVNSQLINIERDRIGKLKEIILLNKERQELIQSFYSMLLRLKADIDKWIQQYVITASDDGKIFFVSYIQENQYLFGGQTLFYIQPILSEYNVEVTVGQIGLGKLKLGQQVNLKVHSYPYEEFGYLTGYISYIAPIPTITDSFIVNVTLPKGLKTNIGKELLFRNNLSANASILTDDISLFSRILMPVSKMIER